MMKQQAKGERYLDKVCIWAIFRICLSSVFSDTHKLSSTQRKMNSTEVLNPRCVCACVNP